MTQKPFPHERYWTSFIFSNVGGQYTAPLMDPLLDALPNDARGLTVLELGAGSGSDTGVFAEDPRIVKVIALDPVAASAQLITASLQGMTAYKAAGNHFADIVPMTARIEDLTPENTPRADILYACGTWMYVEQDMLEKQLAVVLGAQPVGNRMVANFATQLGAAEAEAQGYTDMPPIACITPDALRALLAEHNYSGDIVGTDSRGNVVPDAEALMVVVRAQKGAATAPVAV